VSPLRDSAASFSRTPANSPLKLVSNMEPQPERPVHSFRELAPIPRTGSERDGSEDVVTSRPCSKCDTIRAWVCENEHTFNRDMAYGSFWERETQIWKNKNSKRDETEFGAKGFYDSFQASRGRHIQTFEHHASGEALERSYKDGCHLCTLIWTHITEASTKASPGYLPPQFSPRQPQGPLHARNRQELEQAIKETRRGGPVTLVLKSLDRTFKDIKPTQLPSSTQRSGACSPTSTCSAESLRRRSMDRMRCGELK
jgi:hypothetical protein